MERNKERSVCQAFYETFPPEERVHKNLVSFLMNHPSSRTKIEGWILSEETESARNEDGYDDPSPRSCSVEQSGNGTTSDSSVSRNKFSKCDVKSKKERQLGNEHFQKKNLRQSLRHYNQAIKYSLFPNGSDDKNRNCLPIALANRSAVYYELGDSFYDKALKDIDLAGKFGYPEHLKTKLLIRKASIFTKQGKYQAAKECLEIIKTGQSQCRTDGEIESTKGSRPVADEKINDIEMEILKSMETECVPEKPLAVSKETEKSRELSENVNFENASDCISISTSDTLGRHVIAMTELREGDVLFKELPFASVLLTEFYDSYCHHCHKPLCHSGQEYFFPCSRCTQVLFCDYRCAESAECYHVHECGWLNLLHSVGIAHLALRMVLIAGIEKVIESTKIHSDLTDFTNLEIFMQRMDNYHRVYSLVDHITDMFEEDLFQYTLTASLLTRFLITKTSFLSDISEEMQLQIGGALLRHICQLICNAHAVTDILPDDRSPNSLVVDEYQKRIATAIYPAASIMNHSCNSNITFYFVDGKQLVVKGARTIQKGENVYNCYGPHFRRMSRTERQEILLQQYFFTCDCDKCKEELRLGMSFTDQFQALKCEECAEPVYLSETLFSQCSNCSRKQDMKVKIKLLTAVCDLQKKGDYFLDQGRVVEAHEIFQSCYTSASQILYKYNSQYGKICDSLARCSVIAGDFVAAKKLLKESLDYVEVRFGVSSVEHAKELQKYREVCAEC